MNEIQKVKEGEDSYPELNNDTMVGNTAATYGETNPDEDTSSSSVEEGRQEEEFYDLPDEPVEAEPGEMDRPVLGMRRRKAKKVVKKAKKAKKVVKAKKAKKVVKKAKKAKKVVKRGRKRM